MTPVNRKNRTLISLALAGLLPACQTVYVAERKPPVPVHHHEAEHPENRRSLRKLSPIWWVQNTDDPAPPVWYKPDGKLRTLQWRLRNPFHNFTFYVIGVTDRDFTRYGRHADGVFNPNGGWNWAVIPVAGFIPLPFISYKGERVKFYILWRERGNFGAKFNVSRKGK